MVHLPKITIWHGVVALPRPVPLWLPLAVVATGILLAVVAVGASVALLRDATAHGQPGAYTPVAAQVMAYVNEWDPQRDPLVTLPGGIQAKASNVYGVEIGGIRYYYQLSHGSSFDPLRAGTARSYEVIAVIDADTPWEVLIYRLR